MKKLQTLLVLILVVGISTEALARRVVRRVVRPRATRVVKVSKPVLRYPRLYLGILGQGTALMESEDNVTTMVNSGGGFDLYGGVLFTKYFGLEISWFNSFHATNEPHPNDVYRDGMYTTTLVMEGLTLDLKLRLPTRTFVTPFLTAGGGYFWALGEGGNGDMYGGGFQAGVGVDFALTRWFSLGGKITYRGLILSEYLGKDERGYDYWGYENSYLNVLNFGAYMQFTF